MSHFGFRQRFVRRARLIAFGVTVVGLSVVSACGSGTKPDALAIAETPRDESNTSAPTPTTSVTTERAVPLPFFDETDRPGPVSTTTEVVPDEVVPDNVGDTTDTVGPTTAPDLTDVGAEPFWDVEVLGVSMVGDGEYVRLTEPAPGNAEDVAEDDECGLGWLGYLVDGRVHRYEELGPMGHTRLFNGLRGQDAIVVSCEESTGRVLIQGSAVLPEDGIPRFTSFELGSPHYMSFDADFGWRGEVFGGYAWRDGFDELVYFDTNTETIVDASAQTGTRMEQHDHGFDIVIPQGWEVLTYEAAAVTLAIAPPGAGSYVSVLSAPFAGDPEFPEGAELQDFWTDDVPLWDYVSTDRSTIIGSQTRFNWRLSHEGGTLVVQHLEAGDHDLIIQYFVAAGEDHLWNLTQATTDQIRHYQYATVG